MKILVPLAEGFEEIEAVTIVDVLRRADLDVTLAGLMPGPCRGSRGVLVTPDVGLASVDPGDFDALVLPGGMGGTRAMAERPELLAALKDFRSKQRWVGAICAAPLVLAQSGAFEGVPITGHPAIQAELGASGGNVDSSRRVLVSGQVVTSQGAGTAMEFALKLVELWAGEEAQEAVAKGLVAAIPSAR